MSIGWLDRLRAKLSTVAPLKLAIVAGLIGLFAGAFVFAGMTAGLAWTNTEAFCTGCHEMRDNVFAEYKDTIHDKNRSGVRATCPDCHVPHELGPTLIRKVQATGELWGAITGEIDTKEKFQAHRYDMAKHVWKRMKTTDSLECRNCHSVAGFSKDLQSEKAQTRHAKGIAEGKTCIDCHFGIAHKEPDGPGPQELPLAANK
jgi:cytochrome c-type protein NapC